MSKKLALSVLLVMLGIATWDAVLDHEDYAGSSVVVGGDEDGQLRAMGEDGIPVPPRP